MQYIQHSEPKSSMFTIDNVCDDFSTLNYFAVANALDFANCVALQVPLITPLNAKKEVSQEGKQGQINAQDKKRICIEKSL